MDKAVRSLHQRVAAVEKLIHSLRDAQRQNNEEAVADKDNGAQKHEKAAPGAPILTGKTPTQTYAPHQQSNQSAPKWELWLKRIGVVAGIVYAAITFLLWRDARNNFILGQRAWIGIEHADMQFDPGQKIKWEVVFKNYGNSPAIAIPHSKLGVGKNLLEMRPDIDKTINTLGPTGNEFPIPQGQHSTSTGFSDDRMSAEDIEKLQAGRAGIVIVLIGKILYKDIFGSLRETDFCTYYEPTIPDGLQSCGFAEAMK